MSTQTKKITIDSAAIFFGKVVGLLFGILRLNYIASYLGVANFGILYFAMNFCSLFQVLFDFGMSQLLTRNLARDLSKSRELVGKVLSLKIIVVFIASLIVGLIGKILHFDRVTNWAILLTTVVFAINGISIVLLSAFQAHRKMTLVALSNILNDLLLSVFVILIIQKFPYIITVLLLSIIVAFTNLTVLYFVYRKIVGSPKFSFDYNLWKEFTIESAPIAINSIGISLYTFIPPTILKYTRGNVEVGIYNAGYKLVSILTLVPMTFSQVVYPIFSDFYSNAKEKLSKSLSDSMRVMMIVSFPLVVGTILLAPKIFELLYTAEFAPGIIVLQLAIISNLWAYMNWMTATFLIAVDRQKFMMATSMCLGITISIISFFIVPKFGFVTIPLMLTTVEFLIFTLHRWYLVKIGYGRFSLFFLVKPLIASLVMGCVVGLLIHLNFFILVLIGIIVYFILLFSMKGFGEQELEILRKLISVVTGGRLKDIL